MIINPDNAGRVFHSYHFNDEKFKLNLSIYVGNPLSLALCFLADMLQRTSSNHIEVL